VLLVQGRHSDEMDEGLDVVSKIFLPNVQVNSYDGWDRQRVLVRISFSRPGLQVFQRLAICYQYSTSFPRDLLTGFALSLETGIWTPLS
jgi:hypothetical protein